MNDCYGIAIFLCDAWTQQRDFGSCKHTIRTKLFCHISMGISHTISHET